MRKINKILFLMLLIVMLVFACPATIKAAGETDYSGYVELNDEPTTPAKETQKESVESKQTTNSTKPSNANQTTNSTTNANTATKPHQQAGKFENAKFVTIYMVTTMLIVVGYIKLKKYNF